MNGTVVRHIIAMTGLSIFLSDCSEGKSPFRIVQICLAGPQEVPAFVGFMDSIAQEHQMEFTDRSGATEAELRAIANKNVPVAHGLAAEEVALLEPQAEQEPAPAPAVEVI